ncbi:MAG: transaldolase [Candidatus Sumerlaeia bacterium]|nr:transaldolase [Candidatus Sumerlaeia bacterium]
MTTLLDQLKSMTVVVADTGDFHSIEQYRPRDATTNPSLILAAADKPTYAAVIDRALAAAKKEATTLDAQVEAAMDHLAVGFGLEILGIVEGRVSTEVDARLSYNTAATLDKAYRLMALYEKSGIPRERILIKIASTWEGIKAAEVLEKQGIHCNLTLLFSLAQAAACAAGGITLISPFVGRILDYFKKERGVDHIPADQDPGVLSVYQIYSYYKKFGYKTEVMGASFRNTGEIIALAGCDLLTISPNLLQELQTMPAGMLERKLSPTKLPNPELERIGTDEENFRWEMNENMMATVKLAEGISKFNADSQKLRSVVRKRLSA